MTDNYKEVRFDIYCKTCKYHDFVETKDPCNECLEVYVREGTMEPEMYEEK